MLQHVLLYRDANGASAMVYSHHSEPTSRREDRVPGTKQKEHAIKNQGCVQ